MVQLIWACDSILQDIGLILKIRSKVFNMSTDCIKCIRDITQNKLYVACMAHTIHDFTGNILDIFYHNILGLISQDIAISRFHIYRLRLLVRYIWFLMWFEWINKMQKKIGKIRERDRGTTLWKINCYYFAQKQFSA